MAPFGQILNACGETLADGWTRNPGILVILY
jgi:hypothetical protein